MKKYFKYFLGIIVFILFVLIDQSGVGYKGIITRIKVSDKHRTPRVIGSEVL